MRSKLLRYVLVACLALTTLLFVSAFTSGRASAAPSRAQKPQCSANWLVEYDSGWVWNSQGSGQERLIVWYDQNSPCTGYGAHLQLGSRNCNVLGQSENQYGYIWRQSSNGSWYSVVTENMEGLQCGGSLWNSNSYYSSGAKIHGEYYWPGSNDLNSPSFFEG